MKNKYVLLATMLAIVFTIAANGQNIHNVNSNTAKKEGDMSERYGEAGL